MLKQIVITHVDCDNLMLKQKKQEIDQTEIDFQVGEIDQTEIYFQVGEILLENHKTSGRKID